MLWSTTDRQTDRWTQTIAYNSAMCMCDMGLTLQGEWFQIHFCDVLSPICHTVAWVCQCHKSWCVSWRPPWGGASRHDNRHQHPEPGEDLWRCKSSTGLHITCKHSPTYIAVFTFTLLLLCVPHVHGLHLVALLPAIILYLMGLGGCSMYSYMYIQLQLFCELAVSLKLYIHACAYMHECAYILYVLSTDVMQLYDHTYIW